MEQEKYLNEEKYQETNKKVKKTSKTLLIIGAILLVIGIIMTIAGFISFKNASNNTMNNTMNSFNNSAANMFDSFNNSINNDDDGEEFVNSMKESVTSVTDSSKDSFTSVGLYALGGFVSSAGFVLLIVGGVMAYMAHRREITAYTTQQTMPIKKETINDITPTVADAAGTIAKSVSQGFEEGKKETDDTLNKVD